MTAFIILNPLLAVMIAVFAGALCGAAFVCFMNEGDRRQAELIHTRSDDHD